MNEFKLLIAGGREFSDYGLLSNVLLEMASDNYKDVAVSIVSGMARGADKLGWDFAKEHGVTVYEFPADWDRYGKRAGFMRNEDMAKFSDGLVAFWDGQSRGTAHMIQTMQKMKKPVHIVRY